jgi:hypothetical protein
MMGSDMLLPASAKKVVSAFFLLCLMNFGRCILSSTPQQTPLFIDISSVFLYLVAKGDGGPEKM